MQCVSSKPFKLYQLPFKSRNDYAYTANCRYYHVYGCNHANVENILSNPAFYFWIISEVPLGPHCLSLEQRRNLWLQESRHIFVHCLTVPNKRVKELCFGNYRWHFSNETGGTEGLFAQKTLEITDDILSSYKNQGALRS